MNTVNFSVLCKLIFAFPPKIPECVSVKLSVSSCRLSISLHRSIAQYHKRSSAVNGPAPHEYELKFIEKMKSGQYDQMTVLDQSDERISINVMAVVFIPATHLWDILLIFHCTR